MKPLRYYKQLFLAMGLLGTLPTYALAQDTWSPGELNWDYSGSRVERSLNGDSLVIELTVSPSVKLRGIPPVCLGRRERVCRIGSVLYIRQETI